MKFLQRVEPDARCTDVPRALSTPHDTRRCHQIATAVPPRGVATGDRRNLQCSRPVLRARRGRDRGALTPMPPITSVTAAADFVSDVPCDPRTHGAAAVTRRLVSG